MKSMCWTGNGISNKATLPTFSTLMWVKDQFLLVTVPTIGECHICLIGEQVITAHYSFFPKDYYHHYLVFIAREALLHHLGWKRNLWSNSNINVSPLHAIIVTAASITNSATIAYTNDHSKSTKVAELMHKMMSQFLSG